MTNKELGAEMNQDRRPRPTVVVIGGGYGGVNVAKALDADVDVVLVEPKDAFVHNIGALRALVDPTFLAKIFLPYDRLLAHGRVARGRAVDVSARRVVLASLAIHIDGNMQVLRVRDLIRGHDPRAESRERIE